MLNVEILNIQMLLSLNLGRLIVLKMYCGIIFDFTSNTEEILLVAASIPDVFVGKWIVLQVTTNLLSVSNKYVQMQ